MDAAEAPEINIQNAAAAATARRAPPGMCPAPANAKAPFIVGSSRLARPDAQCSLRRFDHARELRRAIEPGDACGLNPDGLPRFRPRFGFSRDPLADKGGDHVMMAD